jgi:Big-like domain-containing protein
MQTRVVRRRAIGVLVLCLGLLPVGGSVASASGGAAQLSVNPPAQSATTCSRVTFQAQVLDATGAPAPGQAIGFTVTGANQATGTGTTDAQGDAAFSYTGTSAGSDVITVTDQTTPGLTGTASMTWTANPTCGGGGGGGSVCAPGTSGSSSVSSSFNGTAIPGGSTLWFSSVLKVSHLDPAHATTIRFTGQSVSLAGVRKAVPDATLTFSPTAKTATTTFDAATQTWTTTVPTAGLDGNVFLSGLELPVPGGLAGGLKPVSWSGTFSSATPGLKVSWAWAAAVYRSFGATYDALGVKPVDGKKASAYRNADHAGTPENEKPFVTGGARGGGGANYTGSLTPTATITPCPAA